MIGQIIFLLIILALLIILVYFLWPREHPYEILGRADPSEISALVNERLSNNPIEDHFIKAQAYQHILNQPQHAAEEYMTLISYIINEPIEVPTFIHLDTIFNRIEDFDNEMIDFDIRFGIEQDDVFNPQIFSDTQNVHDTTVNNDLREKYDRLKELNGPLRVTLDDVYVDLSPHPDADIINIVINEMRAHYSHISKLDDNEINILLNVYQRCSDTMKDAFFDALKDAYDPNTGRAVCTQGRVARLLEALTLLDEDVVLSEPVKTDDIVRKEFMNRAHIILSNAISSLNEEELSRYNSNDPSIDDKLRNTLENELRNEYTDSIRIGSLNNLIKQAQMGV